MSAIRSRCRLRLYRAFRSPRLAIPEVASGPTVMLCLINDEFSSESGIVVNLLPIVASPKDADRFSRNNT